MRVIEWIKDAWYMAIVLVEALIGEIKEKSKFN